MSGNLKFFEPKKENKCTKKQVETDKGIRTNLEPFET